jgi:uncharacterized repeat protein (TIGR03803 family)
MAGPGHAKPRESVAYSFGDNGASPDFGVVVGPKGVLYGSTLGGGEFSHEGSVYSLVPGQHGYSEQDLYWFCGKRQCRDGARPVGLALAGDGSLYGFAAQGGKSGCFNAGCGLVFRLKPESGQYKEIVLYRFSGTGLDGGEPWGAPYLQQDGTILGVTMYGGLCQLCGAVFAISPSKSGYTETTLYDFTGGSDGNLPNGITEDQNGTIYGTTNYGGGGSGCGGLGCGTLFSLTSNNGQYTENTIHAFEDSDGANPTAPPTIDNATGAIFGTTQYGGTDGYGLVYEFTPSNGGYSESVLHDFAGSDGFGPMGQLLLSGSDLYGSATGGGTGEGGTVFRLNLSTNAFEVLHNFGTPPDANGPFYTTIASDAHGRLYGSTTYGGQYNYGAVFKVVP